jgi:ATP-dependent DNA helicase PIF1
MLGTGKSYVLRELVRTLRSKHSSASSVFVTAPTGIGTRSNLNTIIYYSATNSVKIAACNIGGCTIHSWSGIGLGRESKEALLSRIQRVATNGKRWKDTRVLIIDEVSMLSAELFDKLDYIARAIRKRPEPFGGIQVRSALRVMDERGAYINLLTRVGNNVRRLLSVAPGG